MTYATISNVLTYYTTLMVGLKYFFKKQVNFSLWVLKRV